MQNKFIIVETMPKYALAEEPVANTGMLIRRPIKIVYQAFIDPKITTKFWFTKSSGKLEEGKQVKWEWEMYNASTNVKVLELEENKRIVIEWQSYKGPTRVEWVFTPYGESTFVDITERGYLGSGDEVVKAVVDSTGGFTWTLAGLKGWLEHGIQLNFVADRHPEKR